MPAQSNSRLLASNWTPGKVTLLNALGLTKWNVSFPKLRPNLTTALVAQSGANPPQTQATLLAASGSSSPGSGGTSGNTLTKPRPTSGAQQNPVNAGSGGGSPSANQTLAMSIARSMGLTSWTQGTNWSSWMALWNRESGWNQNAIFPSSTWPSGVMAPAGRAYGIAQSLGHPSSQSTEYGGNGLSPAQSALASKGNAYWQIVWGINYIKGVYGNPANAMAHENSHGWY